MLQAAAGAPLASVLQKLQFHPLTAAIQSMPRASSPPFPAVCSYQSLVASVCVEMPRMKGCEAWKALCAAKGSAVSWNCLLCLLRLLRVYLPLAATKASFAEPHAHPSHPLHCR